MPETLASVLESLRGAGWLLLILLALAVGIFHSIFYLRYYLKLCARMSVKLDTSLTTPSDIGLQVQKARLTRLEVVDRRLPFLYVLINAAPLTGLLGTVAGMLTTFRSLSITSSRPPIDLISQGISQALITTQAGLIIAIPAYMAAAALKKQRDQLENSWACAESILCQRALRNQPGGSAS
jgi:biopolymer transport protein ExbB/TolQ